MSEMSGLAKLILGCIVIGCIMLVHDLTYQGLEPEIKTLTSI